MKAKILLAIAAIASASTLLSSCGMSSKDIKALSNIGSGHSEKWGDTCDKTIIEGGEFNAIDINGIADIVYTQSDTVKVVARGYEKAIEYYKVKVDDGTLFVNTDNGVGNIPSITILVYAPNINDISVNGTGDIDIDNDIKIEGTFSADINGTGDINAKKIQCSNFKLDINGTGDADIKKLSCSNKASISISGTGDFSSNIKAKSIEASSNGTGDIDITVECDDLNTVASGTGDIEIKGQCKTFRKSESGLASIDSRSLKYDKKK